MVTGGHRREGLPALRVWDTNQGNSVFFLDAIALGLHKLLLPKGK